MVQLDTEVSVNSQLQKKGVRLPGRTPFFGNYTLDLQNGKSRWKFDFCQGTSHSRESGNPLLRETCAIEWIPAFAGMTKTGALQVKYVIPFFGTYVLESVILHLYPLLAKEATHRFQRIAHVLDGIRRCLVFLRSPGLDGRLTQRNLARIVGRRIGQQALAQTLAVFR
ncbi:MAG: hypothetical protein JWL63_3082 [Rhodocyclales bacterium]|nr:hypothetical protein [Rhodocyclales bacterium]